MERYEIFGQPVQMVMLPRRRALKVDGVDVDCRLETSGKIWMGMISGRISALEAALSVLRLIAEAARLRRAALQACGPESARSARSERR